MPLWRGRISNRILERRACRDIFQVSVVYQVPEGAAHFLLILADPRGSIPSSLVNAQSKSAPKKWHKALLKAYAALDKPAAQQAASQHPDGRSAQDNGEAELVLRIQWADEVVLWAVTLQQQ